MGTESSGKLRSSSATQEKLQYPLGMLAALPPANGSPAKTANQHYTITAHTVTKDKTPFTAICKQSLKVPLKHVHLLE